jgi:hypothetical protein
VKLLLTILVVLFVGVWLWIVVRDFLQARRQIRDAEDMKRSARRE